ncbi:hypothetical protein F4801DRAFT_599934 [Xylaria longipes]|nr:hypothetical protein F4801DRAFT_599934 [Xylaria longipes]
MYGQWEYDLEDCLIQHSAQWSAFKIPQTLYTARQAVQSSTLLALPNELLLEIFTYTGSVDRLFLALTCKRLLGVSSMIVITIPSAPKHRVFAPGSCKAMLGLLHGMRILNTRDRPKDTSSAICCDCYRYRPKKKRFWKGVEKRYPAVPPEVLDEWYNYIVDNWCHRRSQSYQCPECWCEERAKEDEHSTDI